jgi:type I pantothenate kinase
VPDSSATVPVPAEVLAAVADARARRAGRPTAVGVTGSVAAGKTTFAGALAAALAPSTPGGIVVVSTDGFLLPNAVLEATGAAGRKGHPDTFDRAALLAALGALRAGGTAAVPTYSHETYDVAPGPGEPVGPAEVVLVDGLHLLHVGDDGASPRDHLDLVVYLHADEPDLERWQVDRWVGTWRDGAPYPRALGLATEEAAAAVGHAAWRAINGPNLRDHIAPTRPRADLVVHLDGAHAVVRVEHQPASGTTGPAADGAP